MYDARTRDRFRVAVAAVTGLVAVSSATAVGAVAGLAARDTTPQASALSRHRGRRRAFHPGETAGHRGGSGPNGPWCTRRWSTAGPPAHPSVEAPSPRRPRPRHPLRQCRRPWHVNHPPPAPAPPPPPPPPPAPSSGS